MRDVVQGDSSQAKHWLQPKNFSLSSQSNRIVALSPHMEGATVLDIGCGSGHWRDDWIHGSLKKIAAEVVGVEVDRTFVEAMRTKGFDPVHADVADLDLGRTFDVVFAGELIEHLSCFDGLLEGARRHLNPGGKLILTTPNAFAVSNFVYRVLPGPVRMNLDHTCWFCEDTLRQLLGRFGFDADVSYVKHETPGKARARAANILRRVLPEAVAWNQLLVVATMRSEESP